MKKLLKDLVIVASMIVAIISCKTITAFGYDAYDFSFDFRSVGSWDITSVKDKNTDSYVTMGCTWAEIEGSCYDAYIIDGLGYDRNYYNGERYVYRFYEGSWNAMLNTVYEAGERNCRIRAQLVDDIYGEGALFSGYWYSDSGIY